MISKYFTLAVFSLAIIGLPFKVVFLTTIIIVFFIFYFLKLDYFEIKEQFCKQPSLFDLAYEDGKNSLFEKIKISKIKSFMGGLVYSNDFIGSYIYYIQSIDGTKKAS